MKPLFRFRARPRAIYVLLADGALLALSVPAFYLSLLATQRTLAVGCYVGAVLLCAGRAVATRTRGRQPPLRDKLRWPLLGLLFFAAAALPAGGALLPVAVRLGASSLALLRVGRALQPWLRRDSLPQLLIFATLVLGACGLGFWGLEPGVQSYGDGLWLAFTTAATVGYGDLVPSTAASRIFSVFVVLLGMAVLSLVTASISAAWVKTEERRIEREILHDLGREIGALREELRQSRIVDPPVADKGDPPSPAEPVTPAVQPRASRPAR